MKSSQPAACHALPLLALCLFTTFPCEVALAQSAEQERGKSLTGGKIEVNPSGYTSAMICGRCHVDIYNSWKKSMHAFSLSNPIFDTAYMQALRQVGDAAKAECLRCHAPMSMFNQDLDLEEGVTREGVACDFCHTVTAVHLDDREHPYEVDLSAVKRGIIKKAGSPAHDVAYSALHGTSEFCGGCHDYMRPDGTPIMTTHTEWKNGPYAAEGIQCQACHMSLTEGSIVLKEIKDSGPEYHLHSLIHDTEQLKNALTVEIVEVKRGSNEVSAIVRVENVGSGHMIPTGIPSREVVLDVECIFDGGSRMKDRRFQKIMMNDAGEVLTNDVDIMLHAARVASDNRIAPREERLETFHFELPPFKWARIKATLRYVYSPTVLDRARFDIKMAEAEASVR
jgi:hypothetical protein